MYRRTTSQLAYQAIRIEGGLIPADELTRLTTLLAPDKTEQTESHYGVPKGLKLRDEIARFWRIAQIKNPKRKAPYQPGQPRADRQVSPLAEVRADDCHHRAAG